MKIKKPNLTGKSATLGSWITFPCEASAEIMANAGFDWLVIDMEHAPLGVNEASRLIRVIDLAGKPVLCRLPSNDPILTKSVLDSGAHGIIVPMVESAEDAQKAVASAYYPPKGKRGIGLARAQGYGGRFEEYRQEALQNLTVIAMIETAAGLKNVKPIASTPGIDALLIGPYDLSGSLGKIGELSHPDLNIAKKEIIAAAKEAGIGCGLHIVHPSPQNITQALDEGYTFVAIGVDMIFLDQISRASLKMALNHTKKLY